MQWEGTLLMVLLQKKANLHVSVILDIRKICAGSYSWDPKADLVLFLVGTENTVWDVCLCHKQEAFKHSWAFAFLNIWEIPHSDNPGNAFAVPGCCPRNFSGSLGRSHLQDRLSKILNTFLNAVVQQFPITEISGLYPWY